MIGRRALLEYQAAGFSSRMRRVFRLNSAYGLPIQGSSADFAPRGLCFRVFSSSEFPNPFEKKEDSQMQTQKNHRSASTEIKSSLFIADIKHP
jgi:hypothetical protein